MKPIWIVDDDQSIRFVLEKALLREDLPTRSFTNPRDVLRALEVAGDEDGPQILVSDIRMPGGSGLDLLEKVKAKLLDLVRTALGPDYDVATHFTPRYNPWDQRLCLIPDEDLFAAMRSGKATVATDGIERFTPEGLALTSGKTLPADIVVTATGLKLNVFGDVAFDLDGAPVDVGKALIYKGMMLGNVPNLTFCFGYTNASWTLKADLTSEYVCRLINHMDARKLRIATPRPHAGLAEEPFLDFSSGYVQRAVDKLPKQGTERPWKLHQNYALDLVTLRFGKLDDGTMAFDNPVPRSKVA